MIFVHQLMTADPLTLPSWRPAREAATWLLANGINGAPVVDGAGKLVGMASLARLVDVRTAAFDGSVVTLADVMSSPAATIEPGANLHEAARRLLSAGIQRLVVVDEEERPIGVLTASDLLRAMVNIGNDVVRKDLDPFH